MKRSEIEAFAKDVAPVIKEYVKQQLDPDRIADAVLDIVEKRLAPVRYCGVWQSSGQYQRGNLCTDKGALWHANCQTTARPGTNGDWQMMTKSTRGKSDDQA